MKLKTGIFIIFLAIGLLAAPNCIFAQQYEDSSSDAVIKSNFENTMFLNSLTPLVKGSSGGGKSSSSSKSASKTAKKADGDDDDIDGSSDGGSDDGSGWWIIIIILIIIFGVIGVLIWYFVIRK